MSGALTVTVTLNVPITHGDEVLTELQLVEPDLGSLMTMDAADGNVGGMIALIVACTQLPPSVIKQLRSRDIKKCSEAAEKLMGEDAPAIGARRPRGLPIRSIGRQAS